MIETANLGLASCRGQIIVRMDADDLCHPRRIELQRDYLIENLEVAVVGSLVKGFPEDQVGEGFQLYYDWLNSLLTHEDITREIFVESPIANPCAAFRKEWIKKLGGYQDNGWPEDYDLWLRFYLAGARFAKVPQVLLGMARTSRPINPYGFTVFGRELLEGQGSLSCQGTRKRPGRCICLGRRHDRQADQQTSGP